MPAERFPSAGAFVARLGEALLAERQAARLAPLYGQLQAAAARQEWAEVLTLGGRIQELAPAYGDIAEWMARARDHLRRPPRWPPRERPAWLWPVVGGVAALLVVIGVGVVFLVTQWVPGFDWPLIFVGVGLALLIIGLLARMPDMAVPACIVGGIGGLLYWQNATGRWESWAYAWTLIPGFVGVGIILAGILGGGLRKALGGGLWLILISLVLFAIFGSFLGGLNLLGPYWPVLLIVLGLFILVKRLVRRR